MWEAADLKLVGGCVRFVVFSIDLVMGVLWLNVMGGIGVEI